MGFTKYLNYCGIKKLAIAILTTTLVLALSLVMLPTQTFAQVSERIVLEMAEYGEQNNIDALSTIDVNNQVELRNAINNAVDNVSTAITLEKNITLTKTELVIPANKIIILKGKHNLYGGANEKPTIFVEKKGNLTLDGITVTHKTGKSGVGVHNEGNLVLKSGLITKNEEYASSGAGGIESLGSSKFTMSGGVISHNTGCGVVGLQIIMTGGKICNNEVIGWDGGGVSGNLKMSGGRIFNNKTNLNGGGVYSYGSITMTGGAIYNNYADEGGGIYSYGKARISGGKILNNEAKKGGGIYSKNIIITKGTISGNTATLHGGGIFSENSVTMNGGAITKNRAKYGAGICLISGVYSPGIKSLNISKGTLSGNIAKNEGGAIYISDYNKLKIGKAAKFSKNKAGSKHVLRSSDKSAWNLYKKNIKPVKWSALSKRGFNNYDINYCGRIVWVTIDGRDTEMLNKYKMQITKGKPLGFLLPDEYLSVHYEISFLGWNTKKDGSGTWYTSKTKVRSNITLYPVFEHGDYEE